MVKTLPAVWETQIQSLNWEDALEESVATHSHILAWRIPWTEEPVGLGSVGLQSVTQTQLSNTFMHVSIHLSTQPPYLSFRSIIYLSSFICISYLLYLGVSSSIHPFIPLSVHPSVCPYPSIYYLSTYLSMYLSIHPLHVASYWLCPLSIYIPMYLPSLTSLPSYLFSFLLFSSSFPSFLPPAFTPSLIHSSPAPPLLPFPSL